MVDHVAQVLWAQAQIHLQHDSTQAGNRPVQLEVTSAVPVQDADPVAGLDTERAQCIGAAADARVAVRVGVAIPAAIGCAVDDLLVPMGARGVPDQRRGVELAVVARGGRAAADDVGGSSHFFVSWVVVALSAWNRGAEAASMAPKEVVW